MLQAEFTKVAKYTKQHLAIEQLLTRLKEHHPYTYYHSFRVAELSSRISEAMEMPYHQQIRIALSALLHDIGKLTISPSLLNKTSQLEDSEWLPFKEHPLAGIEILETLNLNKVVDTEIVLYHHENVDGTGYLKIAAENLSLPVRIVRVADSYDAMTTARSYNQPKTKESALDVLFDLGGRHFDQVVVETLKGIIE